MTEPDGLDEDEDDCLDDGPTTGDTRRRVRCLWRCGRVIIVLSPDVGRIPCDACWCERYGRVWREMIAERVRDAADDALLTRWDIKSCVPGRRR